MKEFKGSREIHAVEYAGFIRLNDEPYYEGIDLLDFEEVGEEVARANAKLYVASYDLLRLCLLVHDSFGGGNVITFSDKDIEDFEEAIEKALL